MMIAINGTVPGPVRSAFGISDRPARRERFRLARIPGRLSSIRQIDPEPHILPWQAPRAGRRHDATAIIVETQSKQRYAVDGWKLASGVAPEIVEAEKWYVDDSAIALKASL
jgi:hypothetical protein